MTNYKENVMESPRVVLSETVMGKPAKTYELLGTLTISISLAIPPVSGYARTKSVTLATWRGVKREQCQDLVKRFYYANDEYNFKEGIVTAKWQVVEYL
jgi:hypothetical protein